MCDFILLPIGHYAHNNIYIVSFIYILSDGWEIWTLDYKLKKKLLSTEMDFQRRAASRRRKNGGKTN
jgi:hypothetical protein